MSFRTRTDPVIPPNPPSIGSVPGSLLWSPPVVKIQGIPRPVQAPAPRASTFRRVEIPSGSYGTESTLNLMGEMAAEAASDPFFIYWTRARVLAPVAGKDYRGELDAILQYIKANVTYREDPISPGMMQYLVSPGWLLFVEEQGNCASMSVAVAAMDMVDGKTPAFEAVALNPDQPQVFSHVYPLALLDGEWLAQDAVGPGVLGWTPPESQHQMEPIFHPVT